MVTPFSIAVRVYYEDTDAGGVVYYANYLRFMERARSEWLRSLGFGNDELARTEAVLFAVRSARLDFRKPARLDDMLEVSAMIESRGSASLTFKQEVRRGDEVLCSGEIKLACLDVQRFAPRPIPEFIVRKLEVGGKRDN